jgi:hypothetical protein
MGASHFGRKTEKKTKRSKNKSHSIASQLICQNFMTPSEETRVRECIQELAKILYHNTPPEKCQTFEDIEQTVREHLLESVGPNIAFFLSKKRLKPIQEKSE